MLTSEGEGSIYVTNLDLSEFKDMAGNSGKYSNVDLTQYIIDTTNPEFNADVYDESAPYRVNLGDAYNETTIVNLVKKAVSIDVNYYVSNNGCSLVNGRYSKLEKCTIVVTAEEISGNAATKGVVIEVNNITSIEIKVNDREGYYGTAFVGNKVTDVTVSYIPSNLESVGITASVVMDAIIDSNIIMSGGHGSEVGVGSYVLTLNMSSIVVIINAVPTTISISVISGNYTVKPYEITIDNINKPSSVSKTYDGSASATISGLTATGVNSETVLFEYDAVEYSDKNVGENKVYTIYGVRLSSSESNYVYSGPTTITYNNGVVRALSLDLSEVKLAEVSKYANGNTEVLQRSATSR